jgi:ABC-type branched-subunit amino acid transport system substrate-binding protein
MKGKEHVKIGIIASTTGQNFKAGKGMLDSARYMIERKYGWLEKKGILVELVVKDDNSDPLTALNRAQELVNEDCIAILGPTDSLSLREILISGICENIPVFSTIASATFLSKLGVDNFFRFTTPDFIRAEILVRYVRRLYPLVPVFIGALEGTEHSYGQQLKKDVINALEKYNMKWTSFDFVNDGSGFKSPVSNEPVIACGPSASIKVLASQMRIEKVRSQFFAFGSNSNLLDESLVNAIVVCDLDREDANPIARDEIDHFSAKYAETSDPDLSTMNAISTLCNVLAENSESITSAELPLKRFQLLNLLKSGVHKALLGQISFSESGEMAGYENISVLKVSKFKSKYMFCPVEREERPLLQENDWWKNKVIQAIGIIGSTCSIISLIVWFVS